MAASNILNNFSDQEHLQKKKITLEGPANSKRIALRNVTNHRKSFRLIEKKENSQLKNGKITVKAREPLRKVVHSKINKIAVTQKNVVINQTRASTSKSKKDEKTEPVKVEKCVEIQEVRVNHRPRPVRDLPPGVEYDVDLINWLDPRHVPEYAFEIFEYLKSREELFIVKDYIGLQEDLTASMRSMMVDWMVYVQESLRLNHETLYKAVKLFDIFLMKFVIRKKYLQLLGAATMFILSKYDEQAHATLNDFLYVCGNTYSGRQLIDMELKVLSAVKFDLGVPDSYTFLRRFWECSRMNFTTLILGRYILEYSLMNYDCVSFSDSKMAAAAIFIAMQMRGFTKGWTTTMEHYSGYKITDFQHIVVILNNNLRKSYQNCATIRHKYAHKTFLKVAEIPLKENQEFNFKL